VCEESMKIGVIYYLIPNLHQKEFKIRDFIKSVIKKKSIEYFRNTIFKKHKPVGGIKVIYQHCMMLRDMGYDAYPLVMGRYKGNFFGYDIDYKYIKDVGYNLGKEDVVVATDFLPYQGLDFKEARKVLFMQNWINLDKRLKESDKGKSYFDMGYDYVISCGQYSSDMVMKKMHIRATPITNGIDQDKFYEIPGKRILGRVLAMARKNLADLEEIISILKFRGVIVDLHVVDGLTQNELIQEYQKADIFLATGYPEGFSLPPLEAMCCGCSVVGFTGGGASEYMIDGLTALVSKDGDCIDVANKLEQLLMDNQLKESLRKTGIEKAKLYTLENCGKRLGVFFEQLNEK